MIQDTLQEPSRSVVIGRLSALVESIDTHFEKIRKILSELGSAPDDANELRSRVSEADVWAGFLCEDLALAVGYFEQLNIGPDADAVLKDFEKVRQKMPDYCEHLVSTLGLGFDPPEGYLRDNDPMYKGNIFTLEYAVIVESYLTLRAMFKKIRDSVCKTESSNGFSNVPIIHSNAKSAAIELAGTRHPCSHNVADAFRALINAKGQPVGIGKILRNKPTRVIEKLPDPLRKIIKCEGNKGYRLIIFD